MPARARRYPPTVHWFADGRALCGNVSKYGVATTTDPQLVSCAKCWWNPRFPRPADPEVSGNG